MKKRKEEILRSKEQSTEQSKEQSTEQSTEQFSVQSMVQSTVQSTEQSSVQSNDTYVYGVGILAVLAIGVCVFFNTFRLAAMKRKVMPSQHEQKQDQPPK